MAERGRARNSKRPRASQAKKASVTQRAEDLLEKAISYLEREYEIYAASPGNHQEIIRIAKALETFTRQVGKGDGPTGPSPKDKFLQAFLGNQT